MNASLGIHGYLKFLSCCLFVLTPLLNWSRERACVIKSYLLIMKKCYSTGSLNYHKTEPAWTTVLTTGISFIIIKFNTCTTTSDSVLTNLSMTSWTAIPVLSLFLVMSSMNSTSWSSNDNCFLNPSCMLFDLHDVLCGW